MLPVSWCSALVAGPPPLLVLDRTSGYLRQGLAGRQSKQQQSDESRSVHAPAASWLAHGERVRVAVGPCLIRLLADIADAIGINVCLVHIGQSRAIIVVVQPAVAIQVQVAGITTTIVVNVSVAGRCLIDA